MQGSAPLSKEGYSLVLDIYLGGVSGALCKKNSPEHLTHHKTPIPQENITIELLQKTPLLIRKAIEDLLSKKEKVLNTYIFIDAPLSYTETEKVVFQKDDKTFFETKSKIIEGSALSIPQTYTNLLGVYSSDGIVVEHAPKKHTLNGYLATNLSLPGTRSASVSQQWIQREIFEVIQELKRTFSLGEIIFLPFPDIEKNKAVFFLGDTVSTLRFKDKTILIGAGTQIAVTACAHTLSQSVSHVESVLKAVARNHGTKEAAYKSILAYFSEAVLRAFKQEAFIGEIDYSCVYIGETYMFPVIKDAFSSFKNINFAPKTTESALRLSYIIKNKVQ